VEALQGGSGEGYGYAGKTEVEEEALAGGSYRLQRQDAASFSQLPSLAQVAAAGSGGHSGSLAEGMATGEAGGGGAGTGGGDALADQEHAPDGAYRNEGTGYGGSGWESADCAGVPDVAEGGEDVVMSDAGVGGGDAPVQQGQFVHGVEGSEYSAARVEGYSAEGGGGGMDVGQVDLAGDWDDDKRDDALF